MAHEEVFGWIASDCSGEKRHAKRHRDLRSLAILVMEYAPRVPATQQSVLLEVLHESEDKVLSTSNVHLMIDCRLSQLYNYLHPYGV